jgi:hypothetical protein
MSQRKANGQFGTANSGRPVGARNKLHADMIEAYAKVFADNPKAFEILFKENPREFLRLGIAMLPKEYVNDAGNDPLAGKTPEQLRALIEFVEMQIAERDGGHA